MSFSSDVKDELALSARASGRQEKLALLAALTHTAGSMVLGRGGIGVQYITENGNVARLAAALAQELYGVQADISISEKERLNSVSNVVRLSGGGARRLLEESGCLPVEEGELTLGSIPPEIVSSDSGARCFLRGAFLGAGSVNDPSKGYHLEIVCRYERFAQGLCGLMGEKGIPARYSGRKNSYVAYLKEGEVVSDFLALVGAMGSKLAFEDARILRSVSNQLNRRQNFEDANMNKAAAAAAQQLLDIEVIRRGAGLETLPKRLRETAELRLNNPEATLSELAAMGEISRSGLNHRLGKLSEMANELRLGGAGISGISDNQERQ